MLLDWPVDDDHGDHARLKLALEAAGLDLWENDLANGRVTHSVGKVFQELGYAPDEAIDLVEHLYSIIHPDDNPKVRRAVEEHVAGISEAYRCEFRLRSKSGDWKWYANYGRIMDRHVAAPGHRFIGVTFNIDDRKRRETELEELNARLAAEEREMAGLVEQQHAILHSDLIAIAILKRRSFVWVNPSFEAVLGYSVGELAGRSTRLIHESDSEFADTGRGAFAVLVKGGVYRAEKNYVRKDGSVISAEIRGTMLHRGGGETLWELLDITDRLRGRAEIASAYQRLAHSEAQLRRTQGVYHALAASAEALLQSTTESAMIARLCRGLVDCSDIIAAWVANPAAAGVSRRLAGEAGCEGQPPPDGAKCRAESEADAAVAQAWRTGATTIRAGLDSGGSAQAVLATPIRREQRVWGVLGLVGADEDFFDRATRQACEQVAALLGHGLDELDRKSALQALQGAESERARTDALTGLPNRLAFSEYLPGALERARRRKSVVAVGMLDLDDFKPVNDRYGHAAGDVLLQKLARALRSRVRKSNFLARLGGDEFALIFEDLDAERVDRQLGAALDRLHTGVETPFDLGDQRSAHVGMTMGLALYPQDAEEPDTLLRLADAAMYASKADKVDRQRWWRIGSAASDHAETQVRESALDIFSAEAAALLGSLDPPMLAAVASDFVEAFYADLAAQTELNLILRCLGPEEFAHLKCAQSTHLLFLLRPDTTREAVEERAGRLGRVHALAGVPAGSMEQAFSMYEDRLRDQLEKTLISSRQRYLVMRVASGRLRLDVQLQLQAIERTTGAYFALLQSSGKSGARWVDVLPTTLDALCALPGVCHAVVFRPDEHGVLRIEVGAGRDFARVADVIQSGGIHPSVNPAPGLEHGPLAMAWFAREVQVVDAYRLDPRLATWQELATDLGWRSAATIPIANGDDTDSVLMLFGAYAHQFSSHWARSWLELLRSRIDALFAGTARNHRPMHPAQVRAFRELLYGQGLRMWVQPIVDLRTGAISKVEALARLHGIEGDVASPGRFLPAFGEQELHALFRQGLAQALDALEVWDAQGIEVDVSVNLPPSTLVHPDCALWVEQALRRSRIAPTRLTLEILENEDLDRARSDEAIRAVDALGVRLALDDLGSGYSSLTRLASLPIDTVKIDQGLMRGVSRDPIKTIRLLATLVRIGEEFARRTVVEGLEDEGFVDAARLLGADHGQGYGLARPMRIADFPAWLRDRAAGQGGDPTPRTWPGALAYHWVATRGALHGRGAAAADSCPLARFLEAQGVADPEVWRWHALAGLDPADARREHAADALAGWLAQRVLEIYAQA